MSARVKREEPKTAEEAVIRYRPYVCKTAQRFSEHGAPQEDLIQVGLLAVALAFPKWDPKGGANMLTWIRQPVRRAMLLLAIRSRHSGFRGKSDRDGKAQRTPIASLDAPIVLDANSYSEGSLHDIVGTFEEPKDVLALRRLPAAVASLRHRQRQVIRWRFGDGLTLDEAGKRMGVSKERVRQIEKDALENLRTRMKGKGSHDVC